jgi:putative ABC transport system permease protein
VQSSASAPAAAGLCERLRRTQRLLGPTAGEALERLGAERRGYGPTLVGIVWGAAAVIILLSVGSGLGDFLDLGLEKTGDRWVQITAGETTAATDGRRAGRALAWTDDDAKLLRAVVPHADQVVAENEYLLRVASDRQVRANVVSAAAPELHRIRGHVIGRGRYLDPEDERSSRHVAVLGAQAAEFFFPGADPLGRTVRIEGVPFAVIGVLARKGFQFFIHKEVHDAMIFVPLSSGRAVTGERRQVQNLLLRLRSLEDEASVRAAATAALRRRHRLVAGDAEAIHFLSVPEAVAPIRNILGALHVALGLVGAVALGMAAIGVANLMLAHLRERRAELALRRACGARRSDVLTQVLIEVAVIVFASGILGAVCGLALVGLVHVLPLPASVPRPVLAPSVVVATLFVLATTALLSGILPARVASRADPAAALRSL